MSPRDVINIRLLAKLLDRPGQGYNPLKDDAQADELVAKFGLTVTSFRERKKGPDAPSGVWEVSHKGRFLCGRTANQPWSRNAAIVHGACILHDDNWDEMPWNCFSMGLDPFKIGHIVDARDYGDPYLPGPEHMFPESARGPRAPKAKKKTTPPPSQFSEAKEKYKRRKARVARS